MFRCVFARNFHNHILQALLRFFLATCHQHPGTGNFLFVVAFLGDQNPQEKEVELSPRMLELATPRKPRRMGGASIGDVNDMGVSLKRMASLCHPI